jgi:hypothetical protein
MFSPFASNRRIAALVLLLLGTLGSSAMAQVKLPGGKDKDQDQNKEVSAEKAAPGTWQVLGRATVDDGKDKDEFKIEGADRFRNLRVKAQKQDIEMKDMDVYYEDGGKEDIEVKETIKAGGQTRPLQLKGDSKRIKRVEFSYSAKGKGDAKGIIILEGQK